MENFSFLRGQPPVNSTSNSMNLSVIVLTPVSEKISFIYTCWCYIGTLVAMPINGQITVTASQVTAISRILAGIPYITNSPVVNCLEL
jgi:hypothetical protein